MLLLTGYCWGEEEEREEGGGRVEMREREGVREDREGGQGGGRERSG